MAMGKRGGRAGRFVRTHVEISIDLDETQLKSMIHSLNKENKNTEGSEYTRTVWSAELLKDSHDLMNLPFE